MKRATQSITIPVVADARDIVKDAIGELCDKLTQDELAYAVIYVHTEFQRRYRERIRS